ncbi:NAD(P)/FAD-dependent oxidoreductase [Pleomorphomonas carboxyditropha]|uniref:NAD(P)/FAD-dependent oxidoreductase n=1 Tax=Pleomorphomonas carboxyditropha TaxID=2023338 RepID=UPI001A9C5C68|nr:FAD-binding oxidoreductase [Pleomorphomonas carboxyditropha]
MDSEKTVVIGAGAVGLSIALGLQRSGIATLLVDSEESRPSASWGNAGHIAIEQIAPLASPSALASVPRRLTLAGGALALPPSGIGAWLPFGLRMVAASRPSVFAAGKAALGALMAEALPAWRELVQAIGRPELLVESGHIVVWTAPAAARAGIAAWRATDIGTARFHDATADELARLGPLLRRPPAAGIVFENTAQVLDTGAVLRALSEAFVAAGGERRKASVRRIAVRNGRAEAHDDTGPIAAARIVVAGGVRSGELLAPLGLKVPIIAERGYHIQSTDHDWPDGLPPLVFEERSTIVTRFFGGLRAASFVELTRHDAPPDERRWRTLERHVGELGLPMRGPFARWHGSRPTLPDYLPAIGKAPQTGNLYYAFGHQHLGLTLAPVTARHVVAMLRNGEPAPAIGAFSLARFQ